MSWISATGRRIMDERGGIHLEQVRQLIEAAKDVGLMDSAPAERRSWVADEWQVARTAVELLWQNDFDRLKEILGRHVRLATAPDSAVHPCPAVCERGWVRYKFAGELPAERPEHWVFPF